MSLSEWQRNAWIKRHQPDAAEVERLLAVVQRDLRVSGDVNMDADWRFVAAYNAALQAATIALHASGYQATKGGGAHHYTIESLKLTIGDDGRLVEQLQAFRSKRGGAVYEMTGIASETEISELRDLALELRRRLLAWLNAEHARLLATHRPPGP